MRYRRNPVTGQPRELLLLNILLEMPGPHLPEGLEGLYGGVAKTDDPDHCIKMIMVSSVKIKTTRRR
jgi:hypothetical protein